MSNTEDSFWYSTSTMNTMYKRKEFNYTWRIKNFNTFVEWKLKSDEFPENERDKCRLTINPFYKTDPSDDDALEYLSVSLDINRNIKYENAYFECSILDEDDDKAITKKSNDARICYSTGLNKELTYFCRISQLISREDLFEKPRELLSKNTLSLSVTVHFKILAGPSFKPFQPSLPTDEKFDIYVTINKQMDVSNVIFDCEGKEFKVNKSILSG